MLLKIVRQSKEEVSQQLDALAASRPDLQIRWHFNGAKRRVEAAPGKEEEVQMLYAEIFNNTMARIKAQHGIENDYKTPVSDIKTSRRV